jgi:nitroreductase
MTDTMTTARAMAEKRKSPETLDILMSRQSAGPLVGPAPNDAELDTIIDIALRAPDHGRVRPSRYIVIRGDAVKSYADLLAEALKRREPGTTEEMAQRTREKIVGIPLIVVVGAKIKTDCPIPEVEQILSVGASCMNVVNAVHAMGYSAKWVTGGGAYDPFVNETLGFKAPDRIVGIIFIGTDKMKMPVMPRPNRAEHVSEWKGR